MFFSQPGPACGAFPVVRGISQHGQEAGGAALAPCSCGRAFPRVFSPWSWRSQPHRKFWLHHYCRAYCLGQGQDSGLAHILQCLAVLKRMWWGGQGWVCAEFTKPEFWVVLSPNLCFSAQTRPSGFLWENSEDEAGHSVLLEFAVFLLLSPLLSVDGVGWTPCVAR